MSMTKIVEIDGKQVPFRAFAAIPRIYRIKFHRDIYKDLAALEKAIGKENEEERNLDLFSLEMFENIAYIMAKHADNNIPETLEEWLDDFNTFSIYQVLPKIIELWGLNIQTDVQSKKTSSNGAENDNATVPAPLCTAWNPYQRVGFAHNRHGERYVRREQE